MGIPIIGDIVQGIAKMGGDWLEGRQKVKAAKIEAEIARYQAETKHAEKLVEHRESYDIQALKQMQFSWKDEYLLFVLTLPLIGVFIPGIQDRILIGFQYLSKTPQWYVLLIVGITAATFGLRWLFGGKVEKIIKEKKPESR